MRCELMSENWPKQARATTALLALGAVCLSGGCFSTLTSLDEAAPANLSSGDRVTVVEVVKGDEVRVTAKGRRATVRLVGVMTFAGELTAAGLVRLRDEGLAALRQKIVGKTGVLTLEKKPRDDRGRYLGRLKFGDVDIAQWSLAEGWGIAYTEFPFSSEVDYLAAESRARAQKKGLWARPKTLELARGLRLQWQKFRRERSAKQQLRDPLLQNP